MLNFLMRFYWTTNEGDIGFLFKAMLYMCHSKHIEKIHRNRTLNVKRGD